MLTFRLPIRQYSICESWRLYGAEPGDCGGSLWLPGLWIRPPWLVRLRGLEGWLPVLTLLGEVLTPLHRDLGEPLRHTPLVPFSFKITNFYPKKRSTWGVNLKSWRGRKMCTKIQIPDSPFISFDLGPGVQIWMWTVMISSKFTTAGKKNLNPD